LPTTYIPVWNGHGDAVNLSRLNADGTLTLANSYRYDTWGKPTTATHNTGIRTTATGRVTSTRLTARRRASSRNGVIRRRGRGERWHDWSAGW